jgi:predicted PurR-regulated permease PerM
MVTPLPQQTTPATSSAVSTDTLLVAVIRIACFGLLGYWTFILIHPFLAIIIWSVVFTVALYPAFERLTAMLGGWRGLVAAAITIIALLLILGPATWLGLSLVATTRFLVERIGDGSLQIPLPPESINAWPLIGGKIYEIWLLAATNFSELMSAMAPYLKPLGGRLLGAAGSFGGNLLQFMLGVVVSAFLFVPGRKLATGLQRVLEHVATEHGAEFINIAGATIRSVSRGVIGIAFLQSLLLGIGFLFAGVPGAGFLSFLAFVFGVIQLGPSLIVIPVIAWSWFTMPGMTALALTIYLVPVNLLDNILRPLVMGHSLNTPMPVIFIGLIGGTIVHGLIGVFVGPIVLAIAWQLLAAWTREDVAELPAATRG